MPNKTLLKVEKTKPLYSKFLNNFFLSFSTWSNGKGGVQSTALGSQRRTSSTQDSSRFRFRFEDCFQSVFSLKGDIFPFRCLRTTRWSSRQQSGDQNPNLSKRRKPREKRKRCLNAYILSKGLFTQPNWAQQSVSLKYYLRAS